MGTLTLCYCIFLTVLFFGGNVRWGKLHVIPTHCTRMKINSFCQSEYAKLQLLATMHDKYDTYEYKVRGKELFLFGN
jgi:hypothetical protein